MTIDKTFINSFAKTTERGAYGASTFKGKIVIGEGEMDEAPMLYINEKVGSNSGDELDIAVDPLEGTNFTAKNLPNALSVLAVSEKGNL